MAKSSNLKEMQSIIQKNGIDTVNVVMPDHYGRLIGKRVTARYFLEHLLHDGMHACEYLLTVDMDMAPLNGFEMTSWDAGYGDFHGVVDENTFRLIPWLDGTALVIVDLEWENGSEVKESPRSILRNQIKRANQRGMYPLSASELEFYLFSETVGELAKRGFQNPTPTSDYIMDYHMLATTRDEDVIRCIRNRMTEAGIPIEFSKGEWGLGQHEINLEYSDALEMADRHVIYKTGVKEIAWQKGYSACFMAKYDAAQAGSSCHIHTSIMDKDKKENLLWDSKKNKESKLFRQFLGGLLKYSRELFLLFSFTVNSYKRYQAGSFAPTRIAWSHDNRTTGYRVIGHDASFRIENRMPGADANPYLAFAAILAAGLAGIDEKLDCGDMFSGDAYKNTNLPSVPGTLAEAVELFEKSEMAKKAFGENVVKHYALHARYELKSWNSAVTDWERIRYFDRI